MIDHFVVYASLATSTLKQGGDRGDRRSTIFMALPLLVARAVRRIATNIFLGSVALFMAFAALMNSPAANAQDDAQLVSMSFPTKMEVGNLYSATIIMRNTGNNWPGGLNYGIYPVPSVMPWLSATSMVKSDVSDGQTYTFNVLVRAPEKPGTYNVQMQMVNVNDIAWFGEIASSPLTVVANTGTLNDAAYFVSQSIPANMVGGQTYPVTVTMLNIGTTTWTAGSQYRLGSQNPQDNKTWGIHRIELPADVPPQQPGTFSFNVTAPTASSAAVYPFQWQMVRDGGGAWFGDKTPDVRMNVGMPPVPDDPVVIIMSPGTGTQYETAGTFATVTLDGSAAAVPPAQLKSMSFYDNGNLLGSQSGTGGRFTKDFNFALGVEHNITLTAVDTLNRSKSETIKFSVVPPLPVARITKPADGSAVVITSGTTYNVQVEASATTGAGFTITKLDLYDGGVQIDTSSSGKLSGTYELAVGKHQLIARATDSKGQMSEWVYSTFTIQRIEPSVYLAIPFDGSLYPITTGTTLPVTVSGSATPRFAGATIISMEIFDNDKRLTPAYTGYEVNTSIALAPGTHKIQLRAIDNAGTLGLSNVANVTVTIPKPTVTLTAPATGSTYITAATKTAVAVAGNAKAFTGFSIQSLALMDGDTVVSDFGATTTVATNVSLGVGTHTLRLRATDNTKQLSMSDPVTVIVKSATVGNDSQFVSQIVPSVMRAGQPYNVTIKMLNTGTLAWSAASAYRLGAQNPQDDRTWNTTGRAELAATTATAQVATFTVPITAPQEPGTYNFQWRMVRDGFAWFGETTPNVSVQVVSGPGPTAKLAVTPTNIRVNTTSYTTLTFVGSGSQTSPLVSKLEVFQDSGKGFGTTAINTLTKTAATLNVNFTATLQAGIYKFKLRSTDTAGVQTDSKVVTVNITNSALLGTTTGVRVNTAGKPQLVGWTCQSGVAAALNYQLLLDAPTPETGGVVLTSGVANVAKESDDAAIQTQCQTVGSSHHFVIDLDDFSRQYPGRQMYVYGKSGTQTVSLPCADNSCTMPGTLRVGITTPSDGQSFVLPNPAFIRMKVTGATAAIDEAGFYINGTWVAATAEADAPGAYSISKALAVSATPYMVYGKIRQGNTTLTTVPTQFMMLGAWKVSMTMGAVAPGKVGQPVVLRATASGTTVPVTVRFFDKLGPLAAGMSSGNTWSGSWTPVKAGDYVVVARAYDSANNQIGESASIIVAVANAGGSGLLPVNVDVPYLNNGNAGTLPGALTVGLTGEASYSLPLEMPPGTAGMQPDLQLSYSSSSPNGILGLGWSLGGLSSIHRCGKTIAQDGLNGRINFDKGDRLCLDGERLVLASNAAMSDDAYWADDAVYRTEIESFIRIKAQGVALDRTFKAERKDGKVLTFGSAIATVNARVQGYETLINGVRPTEINARAGAQSWALDKIIDRSGNFITFHYTQTKATGEHLIDAIRYGGNGLMPHATVKFVYEDRTDTWTRYIDGTRHDLRRRLSHIMTYVGEDMSGEPTRSTLVRDYQLDYETSPTSGRSLLKQVAASAVNPVSQVLELLPATTFDWGKPDAGKTAGFVSRGNWPGAPILTTHAKTGTKAAIHPEYFAFQDFENHGLTDVLERRVSSLGDPQNDENPSTAANPSMPGTLQSQYRYFHNNGGGFDQYQYKLNTNEKFAVLELGDFDGDGAPDLLVTTESAGPKICLSPLRRGISGALNDPIVFACASSSDRPAMGTNTVDGVPYVVDVVGDGRSAIYGGIVSSSNTASLYIQNEKLVDTNPPYSVLPYTPEDRRNNLSDTLQSFVTFDQAVDFVGIGKHADVRWTLPYVRPPGTADNGEPLGGLVWVNLSPQIEITDFRKPGTARLGEVRSYSLHGEYAAPDCVVEPLPGGYNRVGCDPAPYRFDIPLPTGGAVGDFSGSGYSNLMFGFVEINKFNSATRAEATLCLSTGRELDCGKLAQHSGDQYKAVQAVGNFVGDGAPSILMRETVRATDINGVKLVPVAVGALQMCRVTGMGDSPAAARTSCAPWTGLNIPPSNGGTDASDQVYFMDVLGTGRTQAVYYHAGKFVGGVWQEDGRWEVLEPVDLAVAGQALDRIYQVTNGLGAVANVEYSDGLAGSVARRGDTDLTSFYPQRVALSPGKIVSRLKQANGVAGQRSTRYRYFDPAQDVAGRGSLGFGAVESTDEQTNIVTKTSYSQVWPKVGLVRSVTVTGADGWSLLKTTNATTFKQYSYSSGQSTSLPYIGESLVERHDTDHSDMGTVTTTNTYGDDYGNLTKQHVTTTGDNKTFVADVDSVFQNDAGAWLIGLPVTVTTTRVDPASGVLARTMTYEYEPMTGLLIKGTVQLGDKRYEAVTEYLRPSRRFGVVEGTRQTWADPLTQSTRSRLLQTGYDEKGRYPTSVTNAEGHTEFYQYVPATGAISQRIDANNQTTTWATDGFGRTLVETRADGNETRIYLKVCSPQLCPNVPDAATVQIMEQFHGTERLAVPNLLFSDRVGHPIRTQSYAFNGDAIYSDKSYDSRGRLKTTTQPAYISNTTPALASSQEYDDLNRVTLLTTLGQVTRTEYQGLTTKLTNALGQVRLDRRDVIGQVVKVTDAMDGVTEFGYDPFGNLINTTDPRKNVIKVEYDTWGHKTALNDPDLGRIEYVVDPLGRVRKQSTQVQRDKRESTETDYDQLDRLILRKETDLTATWKYDTAANGKGQLAETHTGAGTTEDYIRTHTYDSYGRPESTAQQLTGSVYTSQVIYDGWSRVAAQRYQRGTDLWKQFDMRYSDKGYLSGVERSGLLLWSVIKQDPSNRPTLVSLGNGLTQTLTYDVNSARVTGDQLETSGSLLRLQQGYEYDGLGNVSQRTQYWDQSGFIEKFTYDNLNRLGSSTVTGKATQSFAYFADGSLRSKTGVGTGDYVYLDQGMGAKRPHAVQSIPGVMSYSYDENGNLRKAGALDIDWTSFDMPKSMSKNGYSSAFVYGSEHQRVRQDRGDRVSIVYAGAQEVETKDTAVTVRTYWPMGIGLEIDTIGKPTALNWIHKDRLGSAVALTDQDGAIVERLAYDAWGKRRSADGGSTADNIDGVIDHRGFTGHEMLDQLDLVHMNGRVYDPFTAKFLSGDPVIQDPMNGQNYNRYSYVLNNPANLIDPTGFRCEAVTGTRICAATEEMFDRLMAVLGVRCSGSCSYGGGTNTKSSGAGEVKDSNASNKVSGKNQGKGIASPSANNDIVRDSMISSPNPAVAQGAACVGHEGTCAGVLGGGLGGGWLASTKVGQVMLGLFGFGSQVQNMADGVPPSVIPSVIVTGSKAEAAALRATFGNAVSSDYRATFFAANPSLRGQVVVHHAVERQVLNRYPGVVSNAQMHSLENLRGIPNELNSTLHLSDIRKSWNQFYRENPNPTGQDLLDQATRIDLMLGRQFNPPIH